MINRDEFESLIFSRNTPGVYEKIKDSTVGIAGIGGLGSNVAVALVRSGIGRLILADHDVVEYSNINRQFYFIDQIGMLKVDAIKDTLFRINPYIKLETYAERITPNNIKKIYKKIDVMIEAFDKAEEKAMILKKFTFFFPDIPIITVSGIAGSGSSNNIKTKKIGKHTYLVGDLKSESTLGLMSPRVGIAAYHQANLAVKLILKK